MDENNVVSGAASTDLAASYDDSEFSAGLAEAFGFEREETAGAAESGEEGEGSEEVPEGQTETEEETEPAEGAGEEAAESGEEGGTTPRMLFFKEHGKEFGVPEEAVEAFAKGVGRDSASIIDIYQKGCNYDNLAGRLEEANRDSEIINQLAQVRGINKEQARNEITAMLERIPIEKMMNGILEENPGMKKETAEELAKLRIGQQKPKAEAPAAEENSEEDAARLRELDMFIARHSGEGIEKLPNEVIEIWKKSGINLEEAYQSFLNKEKVLKLEKEIAELRKENAKKEQKGYAKEHSPGSVNSASGKVETDPFIEGLFAEY